MSEIDAVKNRIKNKQNPKPNRDKKPNNIVNSLIIKFLIVVIIFFVATFFVNKNPKIKNMIYQKVYNSNFSFSTIKKLYNEHIGNILPFQNVVNEKKVFSEKLEYKSLSKYNKGVKLDVSDNYLIPAIKGGIVIFSGTKEGLGKTIIVQQSNKIDVWYSNLSNTNVKLYDYIEDNQTIGEAKNNTLYLSFQKDGVDIDYKEVIK